MKAAGSLPCCAGVQDTHACVCVPHDTHNTNALNKHVAQAHQAVQTSCWKTSRQPITHAQQLLLLLHSKSRATHQPSAQHALQMQDAAGVQARQEVTPDHSPDSIAQTVRWQGSQVQPQEVGESVERYCQYPSATFGECTYMSACHNRGTGSAMLLYNLAQGGMGAYRITEAAWQVRQCEA